MKDAETATFGAGCFWGVEQSFSKLDGVIETAVGYAGGTVESPNYKEVCKGNTGHAEVVWLRYDPKIINYKQLLEHFWSIHDPTTPNRQGPDIGSQYRSAIFYYNDEQCKVAMDTIQKLAGKINGTIVTELSHAGKFWPAEEYHQKYFEKNPGKGCHV